MSKFDPLRFIADHAGMALVDAISEAYRQGQQDTESEIVRCRECKYFYENRWCVRYLKAFTPNDYCSYAERKEGEAE